MIRYHLPLAHVRPRILFELSPRSLGQSAPAGGIAQQLLDGRRHRRGIVRIHLQPGLSVSHELAIPPVGVLTTGSPAANASNTDNG
jgi:hypothetical protein